MVCFTLHPSVLIESLAACRVKLLPYQLFWFNPKGVAVIPVGLYCLTCTCTCGWYCRVLHGCPSKKWIRGKFVEKYSHLCIGWMQTSTVRCIGKDEFNVTSLIEIDSGRRSAKKTVRCFWYQNDLNYQAAFFHSYRWCSPPMRGISKILHFPAGLGWTGRPLGVSLPRLKCVLSLW